MATGKTIAEAAADGNPTEIATALLRTAGSLVCRVETDVTQTSATTATLPVNVMAVTSVRVSAGAAAAADRILGDSGSTASATVVEVAETTTDGQRAIELTFEGDVTAFTYTGILMPGALSVDMIALMTAASETDPFAMPLEIS